ncbi:autotransporter outer membrane beta-barrel domain-containing protein [Luteolibacter soli]|uniref:Autotransporter outer membrane beta-barrel domain-containing protein n=1 Tax=Luteolibacter soli TaxID=3135280 RepID=A0ABU9AVN6_9BACT
MKHNDSSKFLCSVLLALAAATPLAHAGKGPPEPDFDTGLLLASGIGNAALTTARTTTRDVGDRLFAMRAGIRPMEETVQSEAAAADPKGGMAKSPITRTVSSLRCWEVYGSLYYYNEEQAAQLGFIPGIVGGPNGGLLPVHPSTDVDIFGGNIGIERHFTENWSAGLALGYANTDADMAFAGTSDIDTFSITPYVSFYKADAFGSADYWADLMYSHGFNDFDIHRLTGGGFTSASPEADTDEVEFTTGINLGSAKLVHGPYAGLRWITGTIDSYNEIGAGGGFFPEQDIDSLVSTLGYQLSFPIALSHGTLVPQVRGAWEHEFEDGNTIFGIPLGQPAEDVAVLGAGLGFYCQSGWNAVLDYEARLSSDIEGHYVSLKIGKEF